MERTRDSTGVAIVNVGVRPADANARAPVSFAKSRSTQLLQPLTAWDERR